MKLKAMGRVYFGKDGSAQPSTIRYLSDFDALPEFAGPKVIYAAANPLASRTAREGITFKKTTYASQCLSHDDLCPQNLPIVGTRKPGDLFQGVP